LPLEFERLEGDFSGWACNASRIAWLLLTASFFDLANLMPPSFDDASLRARHTVATLLENGSGTSQATRRDSSIPSSGQSTTNK
jgi:hypothetical protein